jgi:cyclase
MLRPRLIPVLLLKNGLLVRSENFSIHQIIGNPIYEVKRFNDWNVDELIYLDITQDGDYDLKREDHRIKGLSEPGQILEEVAKSCFMPLTWGGRITCIKDMRRIFSCGADKIVINSCAVTNPHLIQEGAKVFGSQAIVVSIDVTLDENQNRKVAIRGAREVTELDPVQWARQVEDFGAGEILLQSVQRDGTGEGYDLPLIEEVCAAVNIPVIACSGVGRFEDYATAIKAGASAAAAANIWHFKEMTDRQGKRAMSRAGIPVRM